MSRRASRSSGLVLIVDARHGLAELDVALLAGYLASGRPVLLLATKMDKLRAVAQRRARRDDIARARRRRVSRCMPRRSAVVPFSATRRIGIETAEAMLGAWLAPYAATMRAPRIASAQHQRKGPAIKGSGAGPETPSRD